MADALTEAMALVRTATPQDDPWRPVDLPGDGDEPTPIDAAIAEILNAVADSRLVRADLVTHLEAENAALRAGLERIRSTVQRSLDPAVWHAADGALRRSTPPQGDA